MAFQLADLFEHAVDAVPDRLALVCGDQRRTYAELEERANRAAHLLSSCGVGAGDFVGLYATNSAAHVEVMLACYKLRATPVNINFRYVEHELQYLCQDAGLAALVHDAALGERVVAVIDEIPPMKARISLLGPFGGSIDYDATLAEHPAERDFGERSGDDLYVCYTGGTTGMPKGVVWRHEDVFFALGGGYDAYTDEPVPHDRFLAERTAAGESIQLRSLTLPPLMHGAGQWGSMRFFFEGNVVVFQERFDPRAAWELIEREQLTNIMMTGDAMARPLIEALREIDAEREIDLSSLFVIASSAVVFSQSVKNEFLDRLPNVMIFDSIGSTETGQNGMTTVTRDGVMNAGGPTVAASPEAVVLDDANVPIAPGTGVPGRLARDRPHPAALPQRPREVGGHVRHRTGRHPLRGGRRQGAARGRRHHHPARSRLGLHQLRWREDLHRGGRGGGTGPSRRLRRHHRRRPRRALGTAGGGRRPGPARSRGEPGVARRPLPWVAGWLQGPSPAPPRRCGEALGGRQARLPLGHRHRHPLNLSSAGHTRDDGPTKYPVGVRCR